MIAHACPSTVLGVLLAGMLGMALRTRHGTGAEGGNVGKVIEVLPPDELPRVPGGVPALPAPVQRDARGRVTGSEAARELGRRGGKAKAAKRNNLGQFANAFTSRLGPDFAGTDARFQPYLEDARQFYIHTCEHYAALAGGTKPQCSAVIAAHVEAAATSRMFGRFYRDISTRDGWLWHVDIKRQPAVEPRTNYAAASAQHFAAMRTALAAAHEYAVREAQARAEHGDADDTPWLVSTDKENG